MAKAHEPEHPTQRTLTAEEAARRKTVLEGGDPLKVAKPVGVQTSDHGGPIEGYERRLERAAIAVPPTAVDYDRDGYPDAVMGRSGRNYNQRREHENFKSGVAGQTTVLVHGQRDVNFGRVSDLGRDGYRQDQIGYRDRFRVRLAAAEQVAEGIENEESVDPRLLTIVQKGVPSHGSTGVPGGMVPNPAFQSGQGETPPAVVNRTTPVDQAIMAPRTPATGFENKGAQLLANKGPALTESGGIAGPAGTTRHASFGSVPPQGTIDAETGAFTVGTPSEPEPEPPAGKAKAAEHGKSHEPAKAHESTKAHEHPKQTEHHGKK